MGRADYSNSAARAQGAGRDLPVGGSGLQGGEYPSSQLRDLLERISDAFVALDVNWRYTYVNRHAATLFGRRPEDLLGKHVWTEFPEAVGHPFQKAYERALAEQQSLQIEGFFEPWNRWFEVRIYPSPEGLSIFFHEITERKRAEQAAFQSSELLKGQNRILELIAQGASLHDTLDLLLRIIEPQCPGMLCSILLLDADGRHVRHGAAPSLPESFTRSIDGEPIGPQAGSCGTAAYRRESVIVEDIASDPLWENYRTIALEHGLRACWSTPIFDPEGRVLGTFALYFRTPAKPTEHHWELIRQATHSAAIAIVRHRENQALHESAERLRLAVTGGNVGIWEWVIGANRLVWSDQMFQIFGWPVHGEDPTFELVMSSVYSEDRQDAEAAIRRSLASNADFDIEHRIVRPDGSLRWIEVKGRGEFDGAGRPVRTVGVILDITERKQAEEQARKREAQLAAAQRIAQLGSFEWDMPQGAFYLSEELSNLLGLPAQERESSLEAFLARVHPEDRDNAMAAIERSVRERQPFAFEGRVVRWDGAIRVFRSQGRWTLDEHQAPAKLVGICQDITERTEAEDQLRRSEERFQLVARATNDAIWDWDLASGQLWWNQGIMTLFAYPAEEQGFTIGWWSERIHPEDRDRILSGLHGVMDRKESFWASEYRFRRVDGSYADVYDRGFVVYEPGGRATRMIGAMTDITDRKRALDILEKTVADRTAELQAKNAQLEDEIHHRRRAEQLLLAKNAELKAFAYTVSHDLKAPLRGIAGYANEMELEHQAGLSERGLTCLKQILTATRNLDHLIEDLLRYSQLGVEAPADSEVDVRRIVASVLDDRRPDIAQADAEVTINLPFGTVRTWERGLKQVLTNLIDNALKYSRSSNPPRIHIDGEDLGGRIRIAVGDNGIGFDMRYHERIFGLFNRLVRQEDFEGTGAGLAIARKVAEKLGGSLWAESKPRFGATFFLELPKHPKAGAREELG